MAQTVKQKYSDIPEGVTVTHDPSGFTDIPEGVSVVAAPKGRGAAGSWGKTDQEINYPTMAEQMADPSLTEFQKFQIANPNAASVITAIPRFGKSVVDTISGAASGLYQAGKTAASTPGAPLAGAAMAAKQMFVDPNLQALEKGRNAKTKSEAVGYGIAAGTPILGPVVAHLAETLGEKGVPEALGEAATLTLGPAATEGARGLAAAPRAVVNALTTPDSLMLRAANLKVPVTPGWIAKTADFVAERATGLKPGKATSEWFRAARATAYENISKWAASKDAAKQFPNPPTPEAFPVETPAEPFFPNRTGRRPAAQINNPPQTVTPENLPVEPVGAPRTPRPYQQPETQAFDVQRFLEEQRASTANRLDEAGYQRARAAQAEALRPTPTPPEVQGPADQAPRNPITERFLEEQRASTRNQLDESGYARARAAQSEALQPSPTGVEPTGATSPQPQSIINSEFMRSLREAPPPAPTSPFAAIEEAIQPSGRYAKQASQLVDAKGVPTKYGRSLIAEVPEIVGKAKGPQFDTALVDGLRRTEQRVSSVEDSIPETTLVAKEPIVQKLTDLAKEYDEVANPKTAAALDRLLEQWKNKPAQIPWSEFLKSKRSFFKEANTRSVPMRRAYGILMDASGEISPALSEANKSYSVVRRAIDNANIDIKTGRRIMEVGKPPKQ